MIKTTHKIIEYSKSLHLKGGQQDATNFSTLTRIEKMKKNHKMLEYAFWNDKKVHVIDQINIKKKSEII